MLNPPWPTVPADLQWNPWPPPPPCQFPPFAVLLLWFVGNKPGPVDGVRCPSFTAEALACEDGDDGYWHCEDDDFNDANGALSFEGGGPSFWAYMGEFDAPVEEEP